ncbi:peptidase S28, partial [Auriculariales sp. MPI-PUGE-AT-0066]
LAPIAAPPPINLPVVPVTDVNGTVIPPYDTFYYFDQLIDHENPASGTFKQRYYHTWEFYIPGGPIIFSTPGEVNVEGYQGYLGNRTINGRIAQENGGATIVLEHRFFGWSNPKSDLSDESLKLLTIKQAVEDVAYFANNVKLPMPGGDQVSPDKAPWIIVGGCYSGALVSWVMNTKKEFWAGYSSSGVVEASRSNWGYTEVIRQNAQKNCTTDIERVIDHVDKTFTTGTPEEIFILKANWNLANITHLDDVAGALRYNLWEWQSLSPSSTRAAGFHVFCDALEVKDGVAAGPDGWGLEHALKAWGTYWNETYYEAACGDTNAIDCIGSYDPTQEFWHDTSLNQYYRSWTWLTCQELGYSFDGAPAGYPTITSRLLTPAYSERQCTYWFNQTYALGPRPAAVDHTNAAYKGWNSSAERLFFANGKNDPWREVTMSSDFVTIPSTETQPISVSSGGYHCTDLLIGYAAIDASIKAIQNLGASYLGRWIAQWHAANPK